MVPVAWAVVLVAVAVPGATLPMGSGSRAIRAHRRSDGPSYTRPVSKRQVERRLTEVGRRLRQLREELQVADEQLLHLADAADDARLRSLVSETPVSDREHREAARHAEAMRSHRASVADEIQRLETAQDELLDRLTAEST